MEPTKKLMTPFDDFVSPSHLFFLKLLLPYVPKHMQRMLGVYIKYTEFIHTLEYFKGFPDTDTASFKDHPFEIIHSLKPYLDTELSEQLEQMESLFEIFEMMQTMSYDTTDDPTNDFSEIITSLFRSTEDDVDETDQK